MHESHNTITVAHDVVVADRMSGGTDTLFTHCGCGTGSGQVAADTNLDVAIAQDREAVTSSTQGAGAADNDVIVVTNFEAGDFAGQTITECGLFQSATHTNNDMLCYDESINKTVAAADTLAITWTITYGAS